VEISVQKYLSEGTLMGDTWYQRKGQEWDDFNLLANSAWLDRKWMSVIGDEIWNDDHRVSIGDSPSGRVLRC
jgi:hypothetical protein